MVSLTNSKLPGVDIGTNVAVRVPDLDQGRLDPRNVLAVVVDVSFSGLYLLGMKEGLLERLYACSKFTSVILTAPAKINECHCSYITCIFYQ